MCVTRAQIKSQSLTLLGWICETWAPTTIHSREKVEMYHRGSERRITPAEHAQYLYQASADKFYVEYGSAYPCSQSELDFHRRDRFMRKNKGPFVSLLKATQEVMVQNDESRRPSVAEYAAISNLAYVTRDHTYRYHPDIVVKAFNDLDTVFFGGRLHGNVLVSWANSTHCAEIQRESRHGFLGYTEGSAHGEQGQARILLNPTAIFLENVEDEIPLRAMFCTLLHEVSSNPFPIGNFHPSKLTSSRVIDGSCLRARPMCPRFMAE